MNQGQSKYYVSVKEKIHGPFTFAQLQKLMLSNQITRKTQVLQEGVSNWIDAQQIPGLFPQFRVPEPPVVPTLPPNPVRRPEPPVVPSYPVNPDLELSLDLEPPVVSSYPVNPDSELSLDLEPPQPQPSGAVWLGNEEQTNTQKPEIKLYSKWVYGVCTVFFPGLGHFLLNKKKQGIIFFIVAIFFNIFMQYWLLSEEITELFLAGFLGIPYYIGLTYVFLDCMGLYDKLYAQQNPKKVSVTANKYKKKKKTFFWDQLKLREKVIIVLWILYILIMIFYAISFFGMDLDGKKVQDLTRSNGFFNVDTRLTSMPMDGISFTLPSDYCLDETSIEEDGKPLQRFKDLDGNMITVSTSRSAVLVGVGAAGVSGAISKEFTVHGLKVRMITSTLNGQWIVCAIIFSDGETPVTVFGIGEWPHIELNVEDTVKSLHFQN